MQILIVIQVEVGFGIFMLDLGGFDIKRWFWRHQKEMNVGEGGKLEATLSKATVLCQISPSYLRFLP